jgi:hypothetical protein
MKIPATRFAGHLYNVALTAQRPEKPDSGRIHVTDFFDKGKELALKSGSGIQFVGFSQDDQGRYTGFVDGSNSWPGVKEMAGFLLERGVNLTYDTGRRQTVVLNNHTLEIDRDDYMIHGEGKRDHILANVD